MRKKMKEKTKFTFFDLDIKVWSQIQDGLTEIEQNSKTDKERLDYFSRVTKL